MKSLIRNILVLLGYFFVVACPMGPAGAPASVPTGADASRALIGQPLSASGGDASGVGGTTGGGDSGDLGTGGTTGSGASGTVSDAPIVISGNTMGVMPGPNCGYPAGTKVFIDEVQSAVTGDKDELGRDLIQVKGAAYTQSADGTHHGFQGEFLWFLDVADSMNRIGSTSIWEGCFDVTIHAPESAAGKIIRLKKSIRLCPPTRQRIESPVAQDGGMRTAYLEKLDGSLDSATGSDLGSTPMNPQGSSSAEATYDLTIPAKTNLSSLDPCPGPPHQITLPPGLGDVMNQGSMTRQER